MIRINKIGISTPDTLLIKGKEEINKLYLMTDSQRIAYKFKSDVYGCRQVKEALITIQNDKCCFCESKITAFSHGDVEHFRPKAGWKQDATDKLTKPGYYWLAYDFTNLYLSCQICNQQYKKNLFPILDPTKRALNHLMSLLMETPLIIDPGNEDPSKHLEFREEVVVAKSVAGRQTIERTGLNRPKLLEIRFDYLKILKTVATIAKRDDADGKKALLQLKDLSSDKSIYSLMVRDNFRALFI